jgi:hypothetical protein
MQRALYKGEIGFERYIGWCIIAQNLVAMSRAGLKSGALVVGEAMPTTKTKLPAHGCDYSGRSGNWRRGPFTDPYLRLIAGVEIPTAAATVVVPSTVHTYISVTEEQLEKLPATMFRRL